MASFLRAGSFLWKGTREFTRGGYETASKRFDNSCMNRDLSGQHILITGANQGLGFQAAQDLATRGCTLYMACRNKERGDQAVQKVVEATGNKDVHLIVCDVSSLESIQSVADEYSSSGKPLHVLINNAGILSHQGRQLSKDGLELSFATNTLGAFVLTRLLEPVLKRSAPSSKVIFVSSGGMYTEKLELDDMQAEKVKKYDGSVQYARDKRRMIAISERFAKRWQGSNVQSFAMHPGWTSTEGVKKSIPEFHKFFESRMRSLPQGTDTITWLAMEDPAKLESGAFYLDRAPQSKHLFAAGTQYSEQDVDRLWQSLSQLAKLPEE